MANPIQYNAYGNDYAPDQAAIDRQRALATALQQQSMESTPTESIGGWAIRKSPLEGVAKLAKAYAGTEMQNKATESEKDLSRKYAQGLADTLKAAQDDPDHAAQYLTMHPATQGIGIQLQAAQAQRNLWTQPQGAGAPAPTTPGGPPPASAAPLPAAPGGAVDPSAPAVGNAPAVPPMGAPPAATAPMPGAAPAPAGNDRISTAISGTSITRPQALAMILSDPSGKTLLEAANAQRLEATKPVVNRGYGIGTQQVGPDGQMHYVPDPASTQQALGMEQGKSQIVPALQAAEFFDKTGKDVPGYSQGKPIAPQGTPAQGAPVLPQGYMGAQPNGRFQGDPGAIVKQILAIPDPNERAAAAQAFRNQMGNQNPQPQSAATVGSAANPGTGGPLQ